MCVHICMPCLNIVSFVFSVVWVHSMHTYNNYCKWLNCLFIGWLRRFMKRKGLSLRRKTTVSQVTPSDCIPKLVLIFLVLGNLCIHSPVMRILLLMISEVHQLLLLLLLLFLKVTPSTQGIKGGPNI